ncbi:MAG TPA: MarR family transcriptional regulator [Candidatus Lustribacter sp.]|jgi:DNA-binding MarR family transcriptional regulator|nr:MarR family transcriptional regulator [Candidatus Lustribacter sp.]
MRTVVKASAVRPLSTGIGYLIRTTHKVMSRRLAAELAEHGIPFKQYFYIRALLEEDHISQIELSARVGMNRATVTSALDTMEREGLVRRIPDPEDRRVYRVALTAKGRKLRAPIMTTIDSIQRAVSVGLSERELAQFRRIAERMQANLEPRTGSE